MGVYKNVNGTLQLIAGRGGGGTQIQSDYAQADNTQVDFIKNKPTLGTAAGKNVPESGDAASTEVVLGDDSRLSNARTPVAHEQSASTITAGTFAGKVQANATAAATLGNAQVRDIYAGTDDMTAGTTALATGTIYIQYEA